MGGKVKEKKSKEKAEKESNAKEGTGKESKGKENTKKEKSNKERNSKEKDRKEVTGKEEKAQRRKKDKELKNKEKQVKEKKGKERKKKEVLAKENLTKESDAKERQKKETKLKEKRTKEGKKKEKGNKESKKKEDKTKEKKGKEKKQKKPEEKELDECIKAAHASIKDVVREVENSQKMLDNLSDGSKCKTTACRCMVKEQARRQLRIARTLTKLRKQTVLRETKVVCMVNAKAKKTGKKKAMEQCDNLSLNDLDLKKYHTMLSLKPKKFPEPTASTVCEYEKEKTAKQKKEKAKKAADKAALEKKNKAAAAAEKKAKVAVEKIVKAKEKELKKAEAATKKEVKDKAARKERKAKADEATAKEARKKAAEKTDKINKEKKAKERKSKMSVVTHSWTSYVNNWDGKMQFAPGHSGGTSTATQATFISGLGGKHDNGKEDRRFKVLYTQIGAKKSRSQWSNWVNNWDGTLTYVCPSNMVITGLISVHDNGKEDRRWNIRCSSFKGLAVNPSGWSGWKNDWDKTFHASCGNPRCPLVGLQSYHSNSKEDRRWKIKCGSFSF